jgi:hypothetical protein
MRTFWPSVLLVGILTTFPAVADVPPGSAEELFVRARALMKAGDCAGALPLLEQSHELEPTLGARFNMAICESRLGKLTQAAEHLQSVVEGSPPDDERRAHAERALKELLPRIPRLVVEIDEARHRLEVVRLDGETLVGLRANERFAINPGPHELEVRLSGEAPQLRRFDAAERQLYTWSVGAPLATTIPPTSPQPSAVDPNDSRGIEREKPFVWTTQRKAAVVAGGASLAAFGIGTGFALSARSIYDSSEPDCPSGDFCEPAGIEKRDRARRHGSIATVSFTVGVASAFAAGLLWFTENAHQSALAPTLRVGVYGNGLTGRAKTGGIVLEGRY